MPIRIVFRNLAVAAFLMPAATALAADFPTVVKNILDHQADGPLTEMPPEKRAAMTDCVIQTLGALPDGFKRQIVDAGSLEDQEHEFGKVVDADHAKWRQTIAKQCGHIASES